MAVGAAAARPLRKRPAPPAKPRSAPKRKPAPRSRGVAGGVAWIVFVAGLLAGVVALNVAVLQLNVRLDRLAQEKRELRAGNNELASRLSAVEASGRIETLANRRLGLVPAEPDQTTYVTLGRGDR
jgi:cell division protein FtsL